MLFFLHRMAFIVLLAGLLGVANAATIFSESMGTGSPTTVFASYTGWQNYGVGAIAFSGTGDVRASLPSSGYTGATGTGLAFLNGASKSLLIAGINSSGYTGLTLSLGINKQTSAETGANMAIEVSSDGTNFTPLTYTLAAGTAWQLITPSGTIPATANLRLRFTTTAGNTVQFRLDDFLLTGTAGDTTPPQVSSIVRQTPSAATTNAASVTYRVTFNESITVSSVQAADFTLTDVSSSITGESITGVTNINATTFDVTVNTGTGDGSLRLDVLPAATITDLATNDYNATYNSGQTYTIDKTSPSVAIGSPSITPLNSAATLDFPITITGSSTANLTAANVTLVPTGSGVTATISILNGTTANPTVRLTSVAGNGTIAISLAAGIAGDAVGNTSAATANSAAATVDNTAPQILSVANVVGQDSTVRVSFNDAVLGATTLVNYAISSSDGGLGTIAPNANPTAIAGAGGNAYDLTFTGELGPVGTSVTITVSGITDAAGNAVSPAAVSGTVPVELSGFQVE
jgi:hypothetical protein